MKAWVSALVILVASILGVVGCEERGEEQSRMSDTTAATSQSDVENSIKARLDSDAQLKGANLNVDANLAKGQIKLSGQVQSETERAKALELAKSAQPEFTIQDQINVKPREVSRSDYTEQMAKDEWDKAKKLGENVSHRLDDAWIHGKIVAKLIANSTTPERTINVDVVNNVVTLRGKVESSEQKTEAERIAKETEGVKRVSNHINISA